MAYDILSNLQVIFLFFYLIIASFKKILNCHLIMSSILVYHTTVILNTLNKMVNCIELRVIKDWST